MKPRYLIGIAVAAIFIVIAVLSFDKNTIEYASFPEAEKNGKLVQVIGTLVKEKDAIYDTKKNIFTFFMEDKQSNQTQIIYEGPPPPNFEIAEYFVIKGKHDGKHFSAEEIYTKCPSKYEGTIEDLKEKTKTQIKEL
jgi:cytochrome c-type biogenesis protein CcmE